jgi:hypothetical protein
MSLPQLTPAERLARKLWKEQRLLAFLASGEVWTDIRNAARLWGLSPDAAATTLRAMQRDRLIVREDIATGPRATYAIYGITPDGIAACDDAPINATEHPLGRLQASNMPHALAVQSVRITAEVVGWRDWQPGRLLYGIGLRVVPDALAVDPQGRRVALEMERNIKSHKRRREVVSGHVLAIAAKQWTRVLYVCDARCRAERVRALYMGIADLDTPGGRTPFTDIHRARFQFVDLYEFRG